MVNSHVSILGVLKSVLGLTFLTFYTLLYTNCGNNHTVVAFHYYNDYYCCYHYYY